MGFQFLFLPFSFSIHNIRYVVYKLYLITMKCHISKAIQTISHVLKSPKLSQIKTFQELAQLVAYLPYKHEFRNPVSI